METTQPSARRTPIVPGAPDTSSPTVTGLNTHNSADFAAFLGHFDGLLTFQTFDDDKTDDHVKNPALSKILHNPTTEQLIALSRRGAGIYLMVNCGDGAGREKENVTRIRAFCADFDGAALPEKWPLEPSLITETSAGKFHVYWFLSTDNDVLLTNDDWNAQQKTIARMVGSKEIDCTGLNRVMRVPGFLHLKNPKTPFLSRILTATGNRYDLADITAAFPVPEAKTEPKSTPNRPATTSTTAALLTGRAGVQRKYALKVMQEECANLAATPEGNRNNTLNGTAYRVGRLVGGGHLDQDEAQRALLDAARTAGLPDHRITATLNSGYYGGIGNPDYLDHVGTHAGDRQGAPVTPEKAAPVVQVREHTNDQEQDETPPSVADVLAEMPDKPQLQHYRDLVAAQMRESGQIYRYHQIWRSWWIYENGVYVEVNDEKMCQTVDRILQDHGYVVKNNMVAEILIKVSRETNVGSSKTDQGPWELNTKNGILEMQTGEFRPHTPEFYSIIQSAASYEPGKNAPLWEKFITEAVPDAADREILQMYTGLCLTADTSPQKAMFLVGNGGTGKGVFTRTISAVLGGLATTKSLESIRDGSFGINDLVGKRLCISSEIPKYFDWLPFKRITGEDKITVDVKYKNAYTVKLDIKLIILANIMPDLGDDAANSSLTRRFLPIRFDVTPAEKDAKLEAKLTTPEELTGILNWMLDGLQLLQTRGMQFPASTNTLSREIVEESNNTIQFLRDCCEYSTDDAVYTTASDLYAAYQGWCSENGVKRRDVADSKKFGGLLVAAGKFFDKPIDHIRKNSGMRYYHVRLAPFGGTWDKR